MNEEWVETSLGEVTSQVQELTRIDSVSEYKLLGVRWYAEGPFHRETVKADTSKATRLFKVRSGHFIYNRMFAWKGAFGLVDDDLDGCFVSNEFPLYECDATRLLPAYLSLWFRQPSVWFEVAQVSTGTTASRSRWKEAQFEAYRISLPPLRVQRRIVDLMAHLDNQIANLRTERDAAKVSADALSESLIGVHPVQSVRDVADENRGLVGGPFGSSLVSKDYSETGVPVVRGTNMPKAGRYLQPPFVFVSSEKADSLKANWAMDGDVVFTQRGTLGQVGLVAVGQGPLVISQSQMRLRPNPSVALCEYVYYAFSRPSVVSGIQDLNTATANPHINLGILAAIEFPVPSIEIQRAICADLAAAFDLSAALQAEIESLLAFRSVLLSQLLTNKIGLPETYESLLDEVA